MKSISVIDNLNGVVTSQNRYKSNDQPVLEVHYPFGESEVISICIQDKILAKDVTAISDHVNQNLIAKELERIGFSEPISNVIEVRENYFLVRLINILDIVHIDHKKQTIFMMNTKGDAFCYKKINEKFKIFTCNYTGEIIEELNEKYFDYYLPRTPYTLGDTILEDSFREFLNNTLYNKIYLYR